MSEQLSFTHTVFRMVIITVFKNTTQCHDEEARFLPLVLYTETIRLKIVSYEYNS